MRKILKWIAFSVLAVAVLAVGAVGFGVYRFAHFLRQHQAFLDADAAAMQAAANYKPAELYLARLMQSDPALWKSDDGDPPDWLPPELGKLNPHEFSNSYELIAIGGGGGFDDFFGYHLDHAPATPGASTSSFTLTYLGGGKDVVLDQFSLPATSHIEEMEFVKLGLAELARRQIAFANGSQPNLYGDDPVADRERLLSQHPAIAAKLGYTVPTAGPSPSTMPQ